MFTGPVYFHSNMMWNIHINHCGDEDVQFKLSRAGMYAGKAGSSEVWLKTLLQNLIVN